MRYKKDNEIKEGKENYNDECYDRDWLDRCDDLIDAYVDAIETIERNEKKE